MSILYCPFLNTKAFVSVAHASLRDMVFSGRLLKMILPCKSVLLHHPCTQLVLWLKLGFLSGEVWDSALN